MKLTRIIRSPKRQPKSQEHERSPASGLFLEGCIRLKTTIKKPSVFQITGSTKHMKERRNCVLIGGRWIPFNVVIHLPKWALRCPFQKMGASAKRRDCRCFSASVCETISPSGLVGCGISGLFWSFETACLKGKRKKLNSERVSSNNSTSWLRFIRRCLVERQAVMPNIVKRGRGFQCVK